jgi:hypothetical protein
MGQSRDRGDIHSTHKADMMPREPVEKAVKIPGEIAAHVERLQSLPPAAALQRTHSLVCCIQFRTWIRNGRDSVRGISLTKALKQEQHLLLMARRLRETGSWQTTRD